MNRFYSYINTAKEILNLYKNEEPFSAFVKKYFSANKKFGSTDRKQIAHLCYCYFRLGKAKISSTIEERILLGLFLCSEQSNEILKALKPEWNEKVCLTLTEKLLLINHSSLILEVFPWKNELSEDVDHQKLSESYFIQPDLFIRLRPGKEKIVIQKLQGTGIEYKRLSENCIALPNTSKINSIIELDKEAVVQDYNSQKVGEFFNSQISIPIAIGTKISVWDCCAASGGKSIMAYDINPTIELIVSDVRDSILVNLKKRFLRAGIKSYKSFAADITNRSQIPNLNSQIIIADVPCSGSGTWSRTPEQLYFFDERKIDEYSTLQKKIVSSVIPKLQPRGAFIYITCSVFKKENEGIVDFIKEKFHLQLKQTELLKGYDRKADSMFVAVLTS